MPMAVTTTPATQARMLGRDRGAERWRAALEWRATSVWIAPGTEDECNAMGNKSLSRSPLRPLWASHPQDSRGRAVSMRSDECSAQQYPGPKSRPRTGAGYGGGGDGRCPLDGTG